MSPATERTARLIEALLASAAEAIIASHWEKALGFIEDVKVLDPDNPEVPALLQVVERHTEGINADEGRRFVTVLFADIVGSTGLGEAMELEPYAALMRLFETAGRPVIDRFGGHIHNFFGDGIIAYFGFPSAHGDDARRAVSAALELLDEVKRAAPRAQQLYGADLQVRIGICSGMVVIADRGTGAWMERSAAFGPTMNRAARLQSVAPTNSVVIGDSTLALLADEFAVRSLGTPTLKGLEEPIEVFEVLGPARRVSTTAPQHPTTTSPFIGRRDLLDQIGQHWKSLQVDPARSDIEHLVELSGEPGIGKSRLLEEFLSTLDETRTSVVELQCNSYASHVPLWPVRVMMSSYIDLATADSPAMRAELLETIAARTGRDAASTVPVLANLLRADIGTLYPPLDIAPIQIREIVLQTVRDLVAGLAEQQPTVLIVEDAHWADQLTLDLVDRVAQIVGPIIALVATRRAGTVGGQATAVRRVDLRPLAPAQAAMLASALLPAGSSLDTIGHVAGRSDGIPLYIDQISRAAAQGIAETPDIPNGLMELLQARLDAVGRAGRTAQLASVIGREFDLELLTLLQEHLDGAGAADQVHLADDVTTLLASGLIEGGATPGSYRFRHALLETKAYESMLLRFRQQVHAAAAAALSQRIAEGADTDLAFVAVHHERAGQATEAAGAYLDAALDTIGTGALEDALSHLTNGLDLLPDVPVELRSQIELGLCLTRGYVTSSTQGYAAEAAVEDYRRALTLCEQLAVQEWAGVEVVTSLFGIWNFHAGSGDLESCREAERLLGEQLENIDYPGGRPALDACVGVHAVYVGDLGTAREKLERSVAAFEADNVEPASWLVPNDPLVAAGSFLMLARFFNGDEAGAFELRDRMAARAEGLSFPQGPFSLAFLSALEVWIHRFRGDQDAAEITSQRMIELGERHGFVDWLLVGQMNAPATQSMAAPSAELAAQMETAIGTWRSLGAEVLVNTLLIELAGIYLDLDDLAAVRRCLGEVFELAERGQRVGLSDAYVVQAELAAREHDLEGARREIAAAVNCADLQQAPFYIVRTGAAAMKILGPDLDPELKQMVVEALSQFDSASELPDVVEARRGY